MPLQGDHAKWNTPGTPTYYVLDQKRVIRYKWVGSPGAKAIDNALEKLIQEAETNGKKTPKPSYDKDEESSSKHKKKKGLGKINPF